jgi:D-sedoheptulose 7-phosphate isomerase
MDLTEQIIDSFHDHIDSTMQAMEALAPAIGEASELVVQALLNEGKILCCGEGCSGLLSQYFAGALLHRFQRERPSLPAIALNSDAALLSAIAADTSFNEIFAKQIRARAQPQDILLLISHTSGSGTALQTIQSAHDRDVRVIVLSTDQNNDIQALLSPDDVEMRIPSEQRARFMETAVLALNCLCELVEMQLFGSEV